MGATAIIIYFVVLGILAGIGLHRLGATIASLRYKQSSVGALEGSPSVLIQLPLYNEAFVAERLLRAVAKIRYPSKDLRIQVLDDSTDGTRVLVDRVVDQLQAQGVPIEVFRRKVRSGFKAGALAEGLALHPDVDAVAIFDADFIPEPDFLEQVVPQLFAQPDIGLVQARWGHLNRDASFLTRAQAVFLDGHFAVEHAARVVLGHPFNFNGTAGLWRRVAIEEAGGWQSDTITEDLDLSYRAQLAGWRFVYTHDVVAPAELPESWAAFRAQQARWVRGSVETAKKLLGLVLTTDRLTLGARIDAIIHLTNNFAYLLMASLAVMLPLALVVREELGWRVPGGRPLLSFLDMSMLGAGTLAMIVFYTWALVRTGSGGFKRVGDILFALSLGAGMSLSNAVAVIRGILVQRSEFVRTPKKGQNKKKAGGGYIARSVLWLIALEFVFTAYFAVAMVYAMTWRVWGAVPFLALYLFGFATVGMRSALEAFAKQPEAVPAVDVGALGSRQS